MYIFKVLYILIQINYCLAETRYILTSKNSLKKGLKNDNRLRKRVDISSQEFLFVSNLTRSEINSLSNDYHIEKDETATVTWHLDRIDQRYLPLSQTTYKESLTNNSEVDIYIVDTGVDLSHSEFKNNNQVFVGNFVGDNINTDCNGHGTHVASLALGENYGVAKKANLFAVKVLGCAGSGSYSGIISSIEWITNNAKSRNKTSIVNMSLSGPSSIALDTAITNSIDSGIYYVVAAGNSKDNACNYSPARISKVITVAATQSNDYRAYYSNYGPCVDTYAPGSGIIGAWPNNTISMLSGTSMASPVAAGTLAVYIQKNKTTGYDNFLKAMTKNVVLKNPSRTVNKLVFLES